MPQKHKSEETGEHGFKFQLEIFFILCLEIFKLDYKDFALRYELNDIDKLDDIVVEIELNSKKFAFFIQAKHTAEKKEAFIDSFFALTTSSKKYWKMYNLRKIVKSLMTEDVQKSLKKYEDYEKRFVIVTNNIIRIENIETIVEHCREFHSVFKRFSKNEAQVFKFGSAFEEKMQAIIDAVVEDWKESLKDPKGPKGKKLSEETIANPPNPMDFLNKIVVVSNLPEKLEEFQEISEKFVKKVFPDCHSNLLARFLRENINDFIKCEEGQRKSISRSDFEDLIEKSKQEAEMTGITDSFFQMTQFRLQFLKDGLSQIRDSLQIEGKKIIEYQSNLKASILKVYHALRTTSGKVFLLPLSKITANLEKYFKQPQSKIIVYIDSETNWKHMLPYDNVIFIGEKHRLKDIARGEIMILDKPLFEELDEDTKKAIFTSNVSIQNHLVKLSEIVAIIDENDNLLVNFMSDLIEEFITKKHVKFGVELPEKDNLYIDRDFSQNIFDLMNTSNVIIEADPGMGKTSTIIDLARKFKQENPQYWVGVYFLRDYTKLFNKLQSSCSQEFARDFLLDKLIVCESNQELCRKLVEIYMKKSDNVPIFLILDGYDEIFPSYNQFVENFATKLQEMGIKVFITSRKHCKQGLKQFENFTSVELHPFNDDQIKSFIKNFVTLNYPEDVVEQVVENTYRSITLSKRLTLYDQFLRTPILLKMINEIYKKCPDYMDQVGFDLNVFKIYKDIFEMSFDDYYDKEKSDATSNPAKSGRSTEMSRVTEILANLAIEELGMEELVPPNPIKFNATEIIGRGFVTKSKNGEFQFHHRSFAEFFISDAIVRQIAKKNYDIMARVRMPRFTQLSYFTYSIFMDKMQKDTIEFDSFSDMCEMLCMLFFQFSTINCDEFMIIIKYVAKRVPTKGIINFLRLQFEFFNTLENDHIDFFVQFLDDQYDSEVTNNILSLLKHKNFTHQAYFFTHFQDILRNRGLQTDDESFAKFYTEFANEHLKEFRSSFYKKESVFQIFEHRKNSIDTDIATKILSEYDSNGKFQSHDVILVEYLTLFRDDSQEFIRNILKDFRTKKILLPFLEISDCRTLNKVCCEIFVDNKWEYDLYDGKSLLFYCWTNKRKNLLKAFLELLPRETIIKLIESPNFNGKSLIDYYLSDNSPAFFSVNYLKFMYNNGQTEDIFNLIESNDGSNKVLVMLKIFHIYYNAFLLSRSKAITTELFKNIAEKVIAKARAMDEAKEVSLLYPFACNSHYFSVRPTFANEFLPQLNNIQEFLLQTMQRIDDNGNNLLHISAKNNNYSFFEYVKRYITSEKLENCLLIQNSLGENYFHCLTSNYEEWKEVKEISHDTLQKLFLQTNNNGQTLFHRNDLKFFYHFIKMLNIDNSSELFITQDNNKDNILHKFSRIFQFNKTEIRDFFKTIGETLYRMKEGYFQKACSQVNCDGKTPGEVGGISVENLREFVLDNMEAQVRHSISLGYNSWFR